MLALLTLLSALARAPAAPPPGAWPTGEPLVFSFTYEPLYGVVAPDTGEATFAPGKAEPVTWTCDARPAARSGRQEMDCVEVGLGTVQITWGPGRQVRALDISEENPDAPLLLLRARRASVLAGVLELWPGDTASGTRWTQGGGSLGVRVAHTIAPTAFAVTHAVTARDGDRVTVTTSGRGPIVAPGSEVTVTGEAVFDMAAGRLLERWVLVQPARTSGGMFGVMGHKVTYTAAP